MGELNEYGQPMGVASIGKIMDTSHSGYKAVLGLLSEYGPFSSMYDVSKYDVSELTPNEGI